MYHVCALIEYIQYVQYISSACTMSLVPNGVMYFEFETCHRHFAEMAKEIAKKEAEQRNKDTGMRPMPIGMQPPVRPQVPIPPMNPMDMQSQQQQQQSSGTGMGQGTTSMGMGQSGGMGMGQGTNLNQARTSIPGSGGGMMQQQQAPPTQVRTGVAPAPTSMAPNNQPQIGGVATSGGGAGGGTGGFPGTSNVPSNFAGTQVMIPQDDK